MERPDRHRATKPPTTESETAGVITRPPLLFLSALLIGFLLDLVLPFGFIVSTSDLVFRVVAFTLILGGVALATAGIRSFSRAETPVPTNQPTLALVTTGIHARTRNPIYLGLFLIYDGIGMATRNPWTLILTVPLALVIRYGVIAREERYLERLFGDDYRAYKASVRRWI
jgi:protein-S-isoprenylcysteine O-methyltransferase Ste14